MFGVICNINLCMVDWITKLGLQVQGVICRLSNLFDLDVVQLPLITTGLVPVQDV